MSTETHRLQSHLGDAALLGQRRIQHALQSAGKPAPHRHEAEQTGTHLNIRLALQAFKLGAVEALDQRAHTLLKAVEQLPVSAGRRELQAKLSAVRRQPREGLGVTGQLLAVTDNQLHRQALAKTIGQLFQACAQGQRYLIKLLGCRAVQPGCREHQNQPAQLQASGRVKIIEQAPPQSGLLRLALVYQAGADVKQGKAADAAAPQVLFGIGRQTQQRALVDTRRTDQQEPRQLTASAPAPCT